MTRRALPVVLAAVLPVICACSALLPGNEETDRIAETVSVAISWPRQESAIGYARAAAATTAGEDGRLTVIAVDELEAEEPEDPFARLTYRIHLEEQSNVWFGGEPVTACYRADFNSWGVIDTPRRSRCPERADAVVLPPAPRPTPEALVAPRSDEVVRSHLRALPDHPDASALRSALEARLPVVANHPRPTVDAVVDAGDVGVAVRGDDDCLLGARIGGVIRVWSPSRVQMQPGELTCDAPTALGQYGQRPPH